MAAWNNIFDLGEWQLYIRYTGSTETPEPDSRAHWVKVEELDPNVGAVSVVDGEIICEMEDLSGSGGVEISIIAVPVGWTPETASARVTGYSSDDGVDFYVFVGSTGNNTIVVGSASGMAEGGDQVYEIEDGTVQDTVPDVVEVDAYELSEAVPGGEGLVIVKNFGGF